MHLPLPLPDVIGQRDKSPEREIEPTPLTSSPLSPPTAAVDVDPITQRLAVLQKRLDIEMKVSKLPRSFHLPASQVIILLGVTKWHFNT